MIASLTSSPGCRLPATRDHVEPAVTYNVPVAVIMTHKCVNKLPSTSSPNRGGATGTATMAMAIALFGVLWPLIALAIPLLHELFTQASVFDETVYVAILKNVFRNCFNCESK